MATPAWSAPPTFSKAFSPSTIAPGGISTLTFTIDNSAEAAAGINLDFTDDLPTGVAVAATPNAATTCSGGTITALASATSISYTGGTVAALSTCTVSVDVTSNFAGDHLNVSSDLTSDAGNSGSANATLSVDVPPVLGAQPVKDIHPGSDPSYPSGISEFDGNLYFRADDGTHGTELWRSDGTEVGTELVKDIHPGPTSSSQNNRVIAGGNLYFSARDATHGNELWKSDGTETGTMMVTDIRTGSNGSGPRDLFGFGSMVAFEASTSTTESEPWLSDGTAAGTMQLANINPSGGSDANNFAFFNGELFFGASNNTSFQNNMELWKSDLTTAGTVLLKEINTASSGSTGSFPRDFIELNGELFFSAQEPARGRELWKTNGTSAGTVIVKDIQSGSSGSSPSQIRILPTATGDILIFKASSQLWRSDGTSAGTVRVKSVNPDNLVVIGSTLFFSSSSGDRELWKSDGTEAGTVRVKDIRAGGSSVPDDLVDVDGTLYFVANDFISGTEIWRSDGTEAGTVLAADIVPGATGSFPRQLVALAGELFFTFNDSTYGNELFTLAEVSATPHFNKEFSPDLINPGEVSTLNFTIDNTANTFGAIDLDFTDDLPAGMTIATPGNASTTCTGGTLTSPDGGTQIAYTGGLIDPLSSCTVTVDVTSSTPGDHLNVSSDLTSGAGNSGSASATLGVVAPPAFSKQFGPSTIEVGSVSTLAFLIDATANSTAVTGLTFSDSLPASLQIAAIPNLVNTCNGTVSATALGSLITLSGGDVAGGATCLVAVDVTTLDATAASTGLHVNISGELTSSAGSSGTAMATLTALLPGFDALLPGDNLSFEDLPLADGGFDLSVPGWTTSNAFSFNPTTAQFVDEAPDGDNTAAANAGSLTQTTSTVLVEGAMYSLVVDVGDRLDLAYSGFTVELLADGVAFASASNSVTPTNGEFETVVLTATAGAAEDGKAIGVRLISPGTQTVFDDVRLMASAAGPVVTITSPNDGDSFAPGDNVAFAGTANDAEDGDLSASLSWTSSIDGSIGSGASFSTTSLSAGVHTITASATDSDTNTGSADIAVSIVANMPPVVTITSPGDGDSFTDGDSISFAGTANDAEDGDLSASLDWSSSIDGNIGTGASFATSSLSLGSHTITASVTDSASAPGSDDIQITVAVNAPPVVTITNPNDGDSFTSGDSISFTGTANDAEDGDLSASLDWTSSIDGNIGSGASFSISSLSVGLHTITASVTDSGSESGQESIQMTVFALPDFTKVFAPDNIELGQITFLVFVIDSTSNPVSVGDLAFTDTLPDKLEIASPPNTVNTCGGSVTAVAGGTTIELSGGSVGAGSTCNVGVQVTTIDATASSTGQHVNTSGDLTSDAGSSGSATATLDVLLVGFDAFEAGANLSFEDLPLADGGFDLSVPSWTAASAFTFNPTTAEFTNEAPDGDNTAAANAGSLTQTLATSLTEGAMYALVVDIGDRLDVGFGGYTLELLADGVAFASITDPVAPTSGDFATATLSATAGASEDGKTLAVRLVANGTQTNFDNVRVMSSNALPVVTITSPADGSAFAPGANVSFAATAIDPEDGDISASINWTSSIDSNIGSGASFSTTTLSLGTHTINALVTDSDLGLGFDQITVLITNNNPPVVTITSPNDGEDFEVGDSISFAGTANDSEDGDISASLNWSSSIDGNIGSGASFSTAALSAGSHTITASVTDSGGAMGSDDISITVNTPPVVSITNPNDGDSFTAGDSVSFAGTANDAEDGDISASLSWTSSIDGNIGSGASFSTAVLSAGTHTITADVTDAGGAMGSDDISLTVTAPLIANPGFEVDCPATDGGFTTAITSWTQSGITGTYNPTTAQFPGDVTEGACTAYLNAGSLSQVAGQTLVADTTYTLAVDVGDRADTSFTSFTIALYVDGIERAAASAPAPGNGAFATASAEMTTSGADAGKALEVRLTSAGTQTNFDNVRLTTSTPPALPTFSKAFAPALIEVGGVTTLTFTIDNSANATPVTGLAFTDTLPTKLVVAPTPNTMTTCGGSITAPAAGSTISFSGGTVNASSTCVVEVDVTTTDTSDDCIGIHTNVSSALTTDSGTVGAATADLTVIAIGFTALLAVDNFSFEAVALADGGFDFSVPSWTLTGTGTSYNPTTGQFPSEATDGSNTAALNAGSLTQSTATTLVDGAAYALVVDVGDRLDLTFGGYSLELLADGVTFAIDTGSIVPSVDGTFATVRLDGVAGASEDGKTLGVRLTSNGVQTNFDNVRLMSAPTPPGPPIVWAAKGPGPITGGQIQGIANSPVVGAVQSVAPHPSDADILYVGGANGGIWKTDNATASSPSWTDQTSDKSSLSIGVVEFDPTDGTNQTLIAGSARRSSFGGVGGSRIGVLHTTDGGTTWNVFGGVMADKNVVGAAARGTTLLAAVDAASPFFCSNLGIWRSTDTGATWTRIAGGAGTGLPSGGTDELEGDPSDSTRFYTGLQDYVNCSSGDGIYRSSDTGATWEKISDPATMDPLMNGNTTRVNVKIAVSPANPDVVFVGIVDITGQLAGVFRTTNATAAAGSVTWTAMDIPGTTGTSGFVGIHPGGQGGTHFSLTSDPADANVAYIAGDRQPVSPFAGRLFRGDASLAPGSQWTLLTNSGTASNSAPHADSRDMEFDAAGNLIEGDDGGVYKRTSPANAAGDWLSVNGDLQINELHDAAYDTVSDIIIGGAQDNGTPEQVIFSSVQWRSVSGGDGGDVAVDAISTPGRSFRYSSFQNFQAFRRREYDAANVLQSQIFPALTRLNPCPTPDNPADEPCDDALEGQFATPIALNNVDATRIVIGASNAVYESLDSGNTISEVAEIQARSFGRNTLAYGAAGNADVLYVGTSSSVFVRSAAPPAALIASATYPGAGVQGLVGDPEDPTTVFVIDDNGNVYQTSDTAASWSDITGNLGSFDTGGLRSIEYLDRAAGDAIVVGTDRGVYLATAADGFAVWGDYTEDLPDVPIYELDYDSADDRLTAGTMGRGAFTRNTTN